MTGSACWNIKQRINIKENEFIIAYMNETIDYTLVICTFNPDDRILKRCLQAVSDLDRTNIVTETILVDNNSATAVAGLDYVQQYIAAVPSMKILFVKQQGVQFARMAAIEAAKGKYIVYIDYDNEPFSNYLQVLKKLNSKYNTVAAWGPGNVWVDFIDGIDASIEAYAKGAFQERHNTRIEYADETEWQACYPFGTGLCMNAFLLKEYVALAKEGTLTFPGRKENLLTSGEDTQMVLLCIKNGFAAGVAPELKLKHMIPAGRANPSYLVRLIYGTYVCYETCSLQVFPNKKMLLEKKIMKPSEFTSRSLKKYMKAKLKDNQLKIFEATKFMATEAGIYMALQKPLPPIVQRILQKLKVE